MAEDNARFFNNEGGCGCGRGCGSWRRLLLCGGCGEVAMFLLILYTLSGIV